MEVPPGLKYSKEHEWVATEESVATIGITDHAQDQLGEIVYLELPSVGASFGKHDVFGTIEAVKAVSELFSPLSGEVVEVNSRLEKEPQLVNSEPYGEGWMLKLKPVDPTAIDLLLDAAAYGKLVG